MSQYLPALRRPNPSNPGPDPAIFPGPQLLHGEFGWFPRVHFLSTGQMVMVGMQVFSARATHSVANPVHWVHYAVPTVDANYKSSCCSFLFPVIDATYLDTVVILGTKDSIPPLPPLTRMEWSKASLTNTGEWPTGYSWTQGDQGQGTSPVPPEPARNRREGNAIILPDASVVLANGVTGAGSGTDVRTPELFTNGMWRDLQNEGSRRDHHAVSMLLPSGKVLSMGGNNCTADFQVLTPPQICNVARPAWIGSPATDPAIEMTWGGTYAVDCTLPAGTTLDSVVLLRPCSLTHHSDLEQRYLKLTAVVETISLTQPPGYGLNVTLPSKVSQGGNLIPPGSPGYYMMFVVASSKAYSTAKWVRVE